MTSPQPPDVYPFPAPPLYRAWAEWWQDIFAIQSQLMAAQWRFGSTILQTSRLWLEPGVVMIEQLTEQMLSAAQQPGHDSPATPPSS